MVRIRFLTREYDLFGMKHGDNIHDMQMQLNNVINPLASLEEKYS